MGCSPWGRRESDTTERLHFHFSLSCIGEGNGNPLQCSCLENPRDEGAWWAAVHGVAQSWTRLKRLSSSSPYIVATGISGWYLPMLQCVHVGSWNHTEPIIQWHTLLLLTFDSKHMSMWLHLLCEHFQRQLQPTIKIYHNFTDRLFCRYLSIVFPFFAFVAMMNILCI